MPANNDELANRAARQPDYALENLALVRLAIARMGPKAKLLQEIAEAALWVAMLIAQGSASLKELAKVAIFDGWR